MKLFGLSLGAFCGAPAFSQESEAWTESLRTKEGVYAVSVDSAHRRVLLFRADDHASGPQKLRVRLLRNGAPPLEVDLRRVENVGPPFRFAAEVKGWDGELAGFSLLTSADGQQWKELGAFKKAP